MTANRTKTSRRLGALITVVLTTFLVMFMALPSWAATFTIVLPDDVFRGQPGSRLLLHTQSTPAGFVGQTCLVTGTGNNNQSVHPGNDIEIASGNVVTLFGVEDEVNKTTVGDGPLTLSETITVTLVFGEDEVYSAALSILLDCNGGTTTTTVAPTSTSTTGGTTTTTGGTTTTTQGGTTTSTIGGTTITTEGTTTTTQATTSSTVPDEVGGTSITTTTVADEVEGTEVLPFTGTDSGSMMVLATIALGLGTVLIFSTKRDET